jgi:hypothetical protein
MAKAETPVWQALGGGLAGACTLTLINESARRLSPKAPRLDTLGMRALDAGLRTVGVKPPKGERLRAWALAGDLVSNTLFFSLAGVGGAKQAPQTVWLCGPLLGLGAGLCSLALPPLVGLGRKPTRRTRETKLMTVGWYVAGGLATAAALRLFGRGAR